MKQIRAHRRCARQRLLSRLSPILSSWLEERGVAGWGHAADENEGSITYVLEFPGARSWLSTVQIVVLIFSSVFPVFCLPLR
jgi:hypothetical protein